MRSTRPFHPHITIGYRDLSHAEFIKAETNYLSRKFEEKFWLDKIYLWKHNGKHWEVIESFQLRA